MKPSGEESHRWSRGKWAAVIAGILAVHVGFIFAFAERHRAVPEAKARPKIHLITEPVTSRQLARTFFANDPTLFSGVSLHSFSGPAWLRVDALPYLFPDHEKPARWLEVNTNQLGQISAMSMARFRSTPVAMTLPTPKVEPFPFFRVEETFRTQSLVRVVGDLVLRRPELPTDLPLWPAASSSQLLTNSVVELAVCPGGEVVSSRLLGRSGSSVADAEAVRIARKVHFSRSTNVYAPTWGALVFEWRSLPVAETNGSASKP